MGGMATSVRLPDVLKAEASRYAADLGISVNALVAVALREYLDRRPARAPGSPAGSDAPPSSALQVGPGAGGNRAQRRAAAKQKR